MIRVSQCCPGSHTTENLFSTTWIPSTPDTGCDARQTHRSLVWLLLLLWQPGGKPPVATNLNLAYSQVYASTNPNCSCPGGATWRHQIGLLWERLYHSLSIWGYCFLQLPAKDALVPALIWVLSAGQYPLHHSICFPALALTQNLVALHWELQPRMRPHVNSTTTYWRLEPCS